MSTQVFFNYMYTGKFLDLHSMHVQEAHYAHAQGTYVPVVHSIPVSTFCIYKLHVPVDLLIVHYNHTRQIINKPHTMSSSFMTYQKIYTSIFIKEIIHLQFHTNAL